LNCTKRGEAVTGFASFLFFLLKLRGGGGGGSKWSVCLVEARRALVLGLGAEGARRGRLCANNRPGRGKVDRLWCESWSFSKRYWDRLPAKRSIAIGFISRTNSRRASLCAAVSGHDASRYGWFLA
jgi:hypothetical protein